MTSASVVPKVTAVPGTALLYAVLQGELGRARELAGEMSAAERALLREQLATAVDILWGEEW